MKVVTLALGGIAALVAGVMVFASFDRSGDVALPTFHFVVLDDRRVLRVQEREVSIALWNRCHMDGACPFSLTAPEGGEDNDYPATGLSWGDAMTFAAWLSEETGHDLRLPTISEWRNVARDALPKPPEPLFDAPELAWASDYLTEQEVPRRLQPAGTGPASRDGILDLGNNVWEWTADCAPGADATRCPAYFAAGLHDAIIPFLVRDPARGGCAVGAPPPHLGMRLVLDIGPGT
ncbi:formylglycine-generating enzyme family protein [Paracoccus sediminicola]|uniref:formylglycine-generating enzyme family protein n=1 Tax=Paracoccus sediminicola TaxID=3017783 RepID=UPI0022F1000D|nr:SUMF1/EgtB/PvdO family nonheme iron enzyme [Paracoccus sediminicola]WBU58746.1 SUMF1/EgtB/PvdO family nonheme iron enzyme [Paracoccus sediminicola]